MVQKNVSLKPFNTFGIDAYAEAFCIIKSKEDLFFLIENLYFKHKKKMFLGSGSNVLFLNDFDGLIIKNEIKGIEIINEDKENIWVKCFSGTIWHDLVQFCVQNSMGGIENLSLIPGTVGAAPMQNIGAYGVEFKDVFYELEAIDLHDGSIKIFDKTDCDFGYRESVFKHNLKGKYFIYSVTLKLTKHPKVNIDYGDIQKVLSSFNIENPTIKDVNKAVISIRNSKLPNPKDIGNAGSFFKNPEVDDLFFKNLQLLYPTIPNYQMPNGKIKIPAAWLIEQCGFKGEKYGETGNHINQALVIVNYGNASGIEIWNHALFVQKTVEEKFGILIKPEVNIVGDGN